MDGNHYDRGPLSLDSDLVCRNCPSSEDKISNLLTNEVNSFRTIEFYMLVLVECLDNKFLKIVVIKRHVFERSRLTFFI